MDQYQERNDRTTSSEAYDASPTVSPTYILPPTPEPAQTPAPTIEPITTPLPTPSQNIAKIPYTEIVRGNPNYKRVALTFDCGPWVTPAYIERILDSLGNRKVTFFVTGQFMEKYPEIFKRIAQNHEIANHSYYHTNFVNEPDKEKGELQETEKRANSFGHTTKPLWRAPYGARDRDGKVLGTAAQEGYPLHIFWDVDTLDWEVNISPQNVLDTVVQRARNGSIVLQHCNSQQTSIILQTEIERLERMGYEIATVTRVIQP